MQGDDTATTTVGGSSQGGWKRQRAESGCLFWCRRQVAAGSIGAILVPAVPAQQIDRAQASSTGSDTSDFPQAGARDGHETRQSEDTAAQGPRRGRDTGSHERQNCSKSALSAGVPLCRSEPLPRAGGAVLLMCRLESAWKTSPEKPPQKVLAEHQGESHGAAPAIRGAAAEWAGIRSKEPGCPMQQKGSSP